MNAVLTVKYITKSDCLPGHVAINSNKKLSSTSILQLHKTVLLMKTYGWHGILIGMLLLSLHITCLLSGILLIHFYVLHQELLASHLWY